jgi:hypothetical protein
MGSSKVGRNLTRVDGSMALRMRRGAIYLLCVLLTQEVLLGDLPAFANAAPKASSAVTCKYQGQIDLRGLTAYTCAKGPSGLNWASPVTLTLAPATLQRTISGSALIKGTSLIQGMVTGSVFVSNGASLTLQGMVTGSVYVLPGGRADIMGMVSHDVVNQGGVVTIEGTVSGKSKRFAGSTTIASGAVVGH